MTQVGDNVIAGLDRQSLKPSKFSNFRGNTTQNKTPSAKKPFSDVLGGQKHRLPSSPTCHTAISEQDRRARWSAKMTTGHIANIIGQYGVLYNNATLHQIIYKKSIIPYSKHKVILHIFLDGRYDNNRDAVCRVQKHIRKPLILLIQLLLIQITFSRITYLVCFIVMR